MRFPRYLLILLLPALLGCERLLDLKPQQSLPTDQALNSIDNLQVALFGAYDGLQSSAYYGRDFLVFPEVRGDNARIAIENSGRFVEDYSYQLNPLNTRSGFWSSAYVVIARANNVINAQVAVSDQASLNRIRGEAHFLRALAHFDLVRVFGRPYAQGRDNLGVPYVYESTLGSPARNNVGDVYDRVVKDLQEAIKLMPETSMAETNPVRPPFFITRDAAYALLSRVYLYMGEYQKCLDVAAQLSETRYPLIGQDRYIASWATDGGSEEILTLRFLAFESLGADNIGNMYIKEIGYGDVRPTQDYLSTLSDKDIRRNFLRVYEGQQYIYKFTGNLGVPGLYSPRILRMSEVLLNKAEANAKLARNAEALIDLNKVRQRAGLDRLVLGGNTVASEVLEQVLSERRRELAFEGHRSFDLFRNGKNLVRVDCTLPQGTNCSIQATSNLVVYPIPNRELDANPNMVQNPGYNN